MLISNKKAEQKSPAQSVIKGHTHPHHDEYMQEGKHPSLSKQSDLRKPKLHRKYCTGKGACCQAKIKGLRRGNCPEQIPATSSTASAAMEVSKGRCAVEARTTISSVKHLMRSQIAE